jgi:hypothetical protein
MKQSPVKIIEDNKKRAGFSKPKLRDEARLTETQFQYHYKSALATAVSYLAEKHNIVPLDYELKIPPLNLETDPEYLPHADGCLQWALDDPSPRTCLITINWPCEEGDLERLVEHELGHWIDQQVDYRGQLDEYESHGQGWIDAMKGAFGRDESDYNKRIERLDKKIASLKRELSALGIEE